MLGIDYPDLLENAEEVIKVTVDVADSDYGFLRLPCRFVWSCPYQAYQEQEHHGDKNASAV